MELRYLRYFVAVAERLNFTRAAEELHVAQPAVSQQVKTLEEELGVALLIRDKRSVKLTAAGVAFLREAREILAHADKSMLVAQRAARGEIGTLSIGCFSSAVLEFLPALLQSYRAQFPDVRVQLYEMTVDQQAQAFAQERIDVGFTRPLSAAQRKTLEQEHVYRDRLVLALPSAHPLARKKSARLEHFADDDFVMFKRSEASALVDQMVHLCAQANIAPRVVSEPAMMQALVMSVAAGQGVSVVPGCVRHYRQPGVVFLPLRPASPPIELVLAHAKGEMSPTVAAWVGHLRKELPAIRKQMETGI